MFRARIRRVVTSDLIGDLSLGRLRCQLLTGATAIGAVGERIRLVRSTLVISGVVAQVEVDSGWLLGVSTLSGPVLIEILKKLEVVDGTLGKFVAWVSRHVSTVPLGVVLFIKLNNITFVLTVFAALTGFTGFASTLVVTWAN